MVSLKQDINIGLFDIINLVHVATVDELCHYRTSMCQLNCPHNEYTEMLRVMSSAVSDIICLELESRKQWEKRKIPSELKKDQN